VATDEGRADRAALADVHPHARRPGCCDCPFDVIAGLDGHFIWNRSGYLPESTERMVDNILLWRLETKGRPSSHVP
jgi:hypothetical protein